MPALPQAWSCSTFFTEHGRKIFLYSCVIICGQKFSQRLISRIQDTLTKNPDISRCQLSRKICEWLDWRRPNGALSEVSCRVALLKLHRRGVIHLPRAQRIANFHSPKKKRPIHLKKIPQVKGRLSELESITIVPLNGANRRESQVWNVLLDRYHYLGSGPLCGAQMRYLIHSAKYGYIGGLAFSAAAWRLSDRDHWIGWDEPARKKHLNKIVCNSRFLIHPHLQVKNLASHVLSLCIKRLPQDWEKRYGLRPVLLETFVERDRFTGTSYLAGNWRQVGKTKGRGRQDVGNRSAQAIKDIYLYELRANAREILCDGRPRRECQPQAPVDWADEELGRAELGDKRRVERLLTMARDFYANPQANIPQACGSKAKTKAAYRFFDESDNRTAWRVVCDMDKILAPHLQSTWKRMAPEQVVLAVQDTTFLNYSTHPATENLGPIRNKKDHCIGLVLHDTMAFNLEGTPLGLLDAQGWARDPKALGKKRLRAALPVEQKESNKWLKSFHAAWEAQKHCPQTVVVSVGDREADVYELFHLALSEPKAPKLLVRAEQDRLLADGQGHLWEYVSTQPVSGIQELHIPKRAKRPAREAKLEIRFAKVTLKLPKTKKHLAKTSGLPEELTVWAIRAEEIECPKGIEPLQWLLITTLAVDTFEDAVEKLNWYALRYWVEVYHRTLKSGCKIEQRQLGNADRIESCLAIDMVVAWRIFYLTKLGRETPEVPCTVFFEEAEWKALVAYKTQNPIPPEKPPSLREAIHMVASLGGFLGRKSDGEPGTQTLWLGLQRLDDLTEMWTTCISFFAPKYMRSPPAPS